jgi:cell wall-associated NlpC family hydrolase/LysM repeat protein
LQILQSYGLRWTRLCVASTATALFTSAAALSASAVEKHALQPGETLDALARRYHVSVPDLIRANNIEDQNKIPDGRVLTIPPPPRSLAVHPTMHNAAHINKDSVSIRLGPGLEYRRAGFVYEGDEVTVTAEQDGWAQVALEDGKTGWVLQGLLRTGRHGAGEQTASRKGDTESDSPRPSRKPAHHADMVVLDEDRSRARKVARHHLNASASAHKHHAQYQEPKDKEEGRGKREERVASRKRARRHHAELIAKLEHQSASRRVHRHVDDSETAVSSHKRHARHHEEEGEVKVARKHSRHAEKAAQLARASRNARPHHEASEQRVARAFHNRPSRHSNDEDGGRVVRGRHHVPSDSGEASESGSDIVRTAYAYRGTPYVWGGERPGGFDCSGFTMHLYGKKGISLPHSARAQFGMGSHVDKHGMKAGDLVFFHTVTPGISHVGMYVGNGKFVHASSRRSGGVRIDSIDSGYYSKAFRGARRLR